MIIACFHSSLVAFAPWTALAVIVSNQRSQQAPFARIQVSSLAANCMETLFADEKRQQPLQGGAANFKDTHSCRGQLLLLSHAKYRSRRFFGRLF